MLGDVYSGQQVRFGASVGVYLQGNGGNVVSAGCLLEHLFIVGFNAAIQAGCGDFIVNDVWADCIYGLDSSMAGDQCFIGRMRCEPWYGINAGTSCWARPGIAFWMHDGSTSHNLIQCFAFCWKTAYVLDGVTDAAMTDCDCEDGVAQAGSRGIVVQNGTDVEVKGGVVSGFQDACIDVQNPRNGAGGTPRAVFDAQEVLANSGIGYRLGASTEGVISNPFIVFSSSTAFVVQANVGGPWRIVGFFLQNGAPTTWASIDPTSAANVFFFGTGFNGAVQLNMVDGTASGGNVRGAGAVDFQVSRSAATQVASGAAAAIVGGSNNTASANWIVTGGKQNTVSGQNATAFGYGNVLSGAYSAAPGGADAADDGRSGLLVWGSSVNAAGYQVARQVFNAQTSDATPMRMQVTDGNSLDAANSFGIPDGKCCALRIVVTARHYDTQDAAVWVIDPAILYRTVGASSTTLTGGGSGIAPSKSVGTVTGWAISVTADTTLGALNVTVTGAASTSIRWGASIEAVEVA